MTAGKLVAWRKKPGDHVHRGDILAEVDTDKGVIDIETFVDGVLDTLLIQPGAEVPVGTPLARIRAPGEGPPAVTPVPSAEATPAERPTLPPRVATITPPDISTADLSRLRISPSARQRARDLGVDPRQVSGTGRGGAITREDIERAAASPAPAAPTLSKPAAAADRVGRRPGLPERPELAAPRPQDSPVSRGSHDFVCEPFCTKSSVPRSTGETVTSAGAAYECWLVEEK